MSALSDSGRKYCRIGGHALNQKCLEITEEMR